jgi:hypothetical protein
MTDDLNIRRAANILRKHFGPEAHRTTALAAGIANERGRPEAATLRHRVTLVISDWRGEGQNQARV